MTTLQIIWFLMLGLVLAIYAILDGFDLGVGFWSMFSKKDEEKRVMLNSIGPVWDGNEVWLVTAGVVMFAAFPPVYAAVFSGMYLAIMLLLVALIARAVSIEFRSQVETPKWRAGWDWAFGLGSTVAIVLFGVALGNMLHGFPLDANGDYTGGFFDLLNPYSLLIGVLGLAMLATHGALWVSLKASGELEEKARIWASRAWIAYAALWALAAVFTALTHRYLLDNYLYWPALFAIPVATAAAIGAVRLLIAKRLVLPAFLVSSVAIAGHLAMVGASLFPNIVYSRGSPENSLSLSSAASSDYALTVILIVVGLGLPLVLAYHVFVYRSFRGKVKSEHFLY